MSEAWVEFSFGNAPSLRCDQVIRFLRDADLANAAGPDRHDDVMGKIN
jgi:hypothetical protein